jgi:hypothetical protein
VVRVHRGQHKFGRLSITRTEVARWRLGLTLNVIAFISCVFGSGADGITRIAAPGARHARERSARARTIADFLPGEQV